MIIIGMNLGKTTAGKALRDGSVCILDNQNVKIIIAEERVAREKRAGGYHAALPYSLEKIGLSKKDIDLVAYSSCCEPVRLQSGTLLDNSNFQYIPVDHHLSHALSVYMTSGFKESLIMVMDAGGNILTANVSENWWEYRREQHSYYLAKESNLSVIDRDFEEPYSAGIGEIYRAFTYFLGWSSSQYAGKTMALAAYGDPTRFSGKHIFKFSNGSIKSDLLNDPQDPIAMVENIFNTNGIRGLKKRNPNAPIDQVHKDIACWIQKETERAVIKKINHLSKSTNIRNLCLSGGVAYNCQLIGKILSKTYIEDIFVHHGSGDHGQCFGNAIYAYLLHGNTKQRSFELSSPYLGGNEEITFKKLEKYKTKIEARKSSTYIADAAKLITNGYPICWFQGRSEYGPRALGNRSILADPRDSTMGLRLNNIKGRENFMPFAPSVLIEKASEYFCLDINANNRRLYMTQAVKAREEIKRTISAVIHEDGTARIHMVAKEENPVFYELIEEFYQLTGIPMLLNTSFNRRGGPIVETLENALTCFLDIDIKHMIAGDFLITKIEEDSNNLVTLKNNNETIISLKNDEKVGYEGLREFIIGRFPAKRVVPRTKFGLYFEFVEWLKSGRKSTTVRYRPEGIDLPVSNLLDIFETSDFSREHYDKRAGRVRIKKIVIKPYNELNEMDANRDGFSNIAELKKVLNQIYGFIQPEELISIYHICLER